MAVQPARIGTGMGYFWAGGAFLAVAAFGALAGEGPFAVLCTSCGAAVIAVGFWVRLFGMVERRLMDIERRLSGRDDEPAKPVEPASPSPAFDFHS